MKALNFADEEVFQQREGKTINNKALLEEVVSSQKVIDERAQYQSRESTSLYTICARCGQQVLVNRSIERQDKVLCLPCFKKEAPGCIHYGVQ